MYLAHSREGAGAFKRFVDSYARFAPGIDHDLVVIYKAFDTAEQRDQARAIFSHLPHIALEMDEGDFDIGSYGRAAAALSHDYLVCLNTHSEISGGNWLKYIAEPLLTSCASLVGASGSYESALDSTRVAESIKWRWRNARNDIRDPLFEVRFAPFLASEANPRAFMLWWYIRRAVFPRRLPIWAFRLAIMGHPNVRWLAEIPSWPNPHIRTNGFGVRRDIFVRLANRKFAEKKDALAFESGRRGLSATLSTEGELLILDKFGRRFPQAHWPQSNTFRLGDQSALCIRDNQSRNFDAMSPEEKETYYFLTWEGPQLLLEAQSDRGNASETPLARDRHERERDRVHNAASARRAGS